MQAQLTFRRFPSTFFLVALALIAAILLGGALGYVLKPVAVATAPARVVVVHDESGLYATGDVNAGPGACTWVNHVKEC